MERDQSEIAGLGNEEKMLTIHKRKREEEQDLNETAEIVFPFAKTSTLWKEYESMDTPQRPHFGPLIKLPDVIREQCALAFMDMFFNISVQVHNHFPISQVQLDLHKETLVQLEENGFDVTATLSRIDDLLSRKDEHQGSKKGASSKGRNVYITLVRCSSKSSP